MEAARTVLIAGGSLSLGSDTIQGGTGTSPLIDQQGGSLDLDTFGADTLIVQANSSSVPILETPSGGLTLSGPNIAYGMLGSQASSGNTTYSYQPNTGAYDVTDSLTVTNNPSPNTTGSLYVDITPCIGHTHEPCTGHSGAFIQRRRGRVH